MTVSRSRASSPFEKWSTDVGDTESTTVRIAGLCTGSAMLEVAVSIAIPGARSVCHVEREAYPAAVLLARMEEEALEPAPVWWGDIGDVDWKQWDGTVDCFVAGFPCQPWSQAGKRKGAGDDRFVWPQIVRAIRDARPGMVILENVDGLVAEGGIGHVLGDLAVLGFDAEWVRLKAQDVGAPHSRARVFILAYPNERGFLPVRQFEIFNRIRQAYRANIDRCRRQELVDPERDRLQGECEAGTTSGSADRRPVREIRPRRLFPPGPEELEDWKAELTEDPSCEPAVHLVPDGVAEMVEFRSDQLALTGNGVVPLQAAVAISILMDRVSKD